MSVVSVSLQKILKENYKNLCVFDLFGEFILTHMPWCPKEIVFWVLLMLNHCFILLVFLCSTAYLGIHRYFLQTNKKSYCLLWYPIPMRRKCICGTHGSLWRRLAVTESFNGRKKTFKEFIISLLYSDKLPATF